MTSPLTPGMKWMLLNFVIATVVMAISIPFGNPAHIIWVIVELLFVVNGVRFLVKEPS